MEADLVKKFKEGIFDLPIFENALFIFYLLGYNFYEIEVKSMIQNFLKLDQDCEDDILLQIDLRNNFEILQNYFSQQMQKLLSEYQ